MYFNILNFAICLMESLSILLFLRVIDSHAFRFSNYFISFVILVLSSVLITFIDSVAYSILLLNFVMIYFAFWVGFRQKKKDTLFNALFSFLMLLYLQSTTLLFLPTNMHGTHSGNLLGDTIIIFLAVLLTMFSYKYHWAEKYKRNIKISWIFLGSLCLPEIILVQVLASKLLDSSRQTIIILVLLQIVYIFFAALLVSIVQQRNNSIRLIETQKHIESLNDHLDNSRKSIHDFNKHIRYLHSTVMLGSTSQELRDNIDAYCKRLIDVYDKEEVLFELDEPIFRALLYGRRTQAEHNGIDFILYATPVLPNFPLENFKLVEVFDNLMDNAFECVTQLSPPNKWIRVSLACERSGNQLHHILSIENPYQNTNLSAIINSESYTTKGEKHMGIGLKKVASLIRDTGGIILISAQNNVFSVKVEFIGD